MKAGILTEEQGTFVPTYYVEPAIVEDHETLDFVRDAYLRVRLFRKSCQTGSRLGVVSILGGSAL